MSEELQHSPPRDGEPCRRCGLRYSMATSYVPCLLRGETFKDWASRQNEEVLALVERDNPGEAAGE